MTPTKTTILTTALSIAVAVQLATVTAPARAGAQEVAGVWQATWASGVRSEADGTLTVQREATAVLELEAVGDSLSGTWTFDLDGLGRSVWYVHGSVEGNRIGLVATESEIENPPPAAQGRIVRKRWSGTVTGDTIEGEQWLHLRLPDGRELVSGPRPWSAERAGG